MIASPRCLPLYAGFCGRNALDSHRSPDQLPPVWSKNCRKDGELSIPGVASLGGAGYDFLRQSIANRLARRTNGLGAHSGLRHGGGGPRAAGAGGKANARTSIRTGKSEDLGWSAIHRCGARPAGKMGRMPAASAAQRKSRRERGLLMAASLPFVVGDFRILISAIAMKGALNPLIRA
jgi:hypothetical protein